MTCTSALSYTCMYDVHVRLVMCVCNKYDVRVCTSMTCICMTCTCALAYTRVYMYDAHVHVLQLPGAPAKPYSVRQQRPLYTRAPSAVRVKCPAPEPSAGI